ncbi:MAG: isoleucine--tRNA ligase [Anaerolineae bacterium]|nr:isoleucine--tRNA ligase [Anaerolineae bacterium]
MGFKPVDPRVDIQKVEQDQLDFWRSQHIFAKTTRDRESAPRFVFYEGPPTANGQPGSHHVLARAFKDMFPRYRVMQGYNVERRGGWDTHGLPVEIAVEKELGFSGKKDIEAYGIAPFNKKCRDNVFRNIKDWETLTERIAFWVNLDQAYVTFTNDYIESIWWILKQFWDKGLIYQGYKIVPYCTRCGTPLSSHEVALGYDEVKDPSVFVRFPVKDHSGVYFLVWTTTPWTLPGNAALAVGAEVDYVQVEGPLPNGEGTEQLILAESLLAAALTHPEQYTVVKRLKGKDLAGMRYHPLYTFIPTEKDHAYVVTGDFVSTADGTGIVHIAPAFGADDMEVGRKHNLPTFITVHPDGRFIEAVDSFKGQWFKEADPEIIRDLKTRGLMYRSEKYEHNYPFCWRDGTPLMYFARSTWYIRSNDYRQKMIDLNQTIKWVPEHIRDGRFGNWLEDLKDWALGRERYWGTPLPVWIDDVTGEGLCVGSVEELSRLAGRDLTGLDLHRPYVDDITFPNPSGQGGTMRRVPEVIDVWFDSGAMPLAQWGYPHHNQDKFAQQYPADYICEAVDQTRGWFYSLHAISSMLNEQVAYKNVICLGHILDEKGEKMSKSKGNIVNPWSVLNEHGADAFRWYLYTSNPPGEPRRFSVNLVGEVVKKFWLTLWNTYSFFVTYASIDGWTPDKPAPAVPERDLLDRWVLAELHRLTEKVTAAFEDYDATGATRPVEAFVELLSNWYVRRSRRRFWKTENDGDKLGAYATLYECLVTVAHLIAPTMPFLSEALYRNLVAGVDATRPESVHLSSWVKANPALIDPALMEEMALVQSLVSVGLAARNAVDLPVRQPLATATFGLRDAAEQHIVARYADIIRDELNVKAVNVLEGGSALVRYKLSPIFAKVGPRYGKILGQIKAQLQALDEAGAAAAARTLRAGQPLALTVADTAVELLPEEVEIKQEAAGGYAVFEERGYTAVLDVTLTEALVQERLAREVVRRIQTLRKEADFNIADKIRVVYTATPRFAAAIQTFADSIQAETLAASLTAAPAGQGFHREEFTFKGDLKDEMLTLGVQRLS